MMTTEEAKKFRTDYDHEVIFLSRMSIAKLRIVEARWLNETGTQRLFGGPASKDEFISSILTMAGYTIAKLNESIHVLYHTADTKNEVCDMCNAKPPF